MPPRDDEVQALVEQLSADLDRSVLVDDASLRLLAYSPTLGSDDEVRKTAILTRETPRQIRDLHFSQGIATATEPVRTASRPDFGLESRVCVPIRCQGALFGYLWLIDADQSLTDRRLRGGRAHRGGDRHRDVPPGRTREAAAGARGAVAGDAARRGRRGARRRRPRARGRRRPGVRHRGRRARDPQDPGGANRSSARPSAPASAWRWTSSAARSRAATRSRPSTPTTAC